MKPVGKEFFHSLVELFVVDVGNKHHLGGRWKGFQRFGSVERKLLGKGRHIHAVNAGAGNNSAQNGNNLEIHGHTLGEFHHNALVPEQPSPFVFKRQIEDINIFCGGVEPLFVGMSFIPLPLVICL